MYDDSRITVGPTGTFFWNSFESLQIIESGRTPCFLDIQGQFLVQGELTITNLVVNVGENAQVGVGGWRFVRSNSRSVD